MPSKGLECLQAAGANCTAAVLLVTGMKGSSRQVKVAAASGEGGDWVPAGHEAASGVVCYPLPQGWEQENLPDGELQGTVEVTLMQDREVLRSLGPGAFEYAYISSMAVAPAVRRRGLAQALLLAAQQQALLWSQHHLLLHVYDDNLPAVKLYLKHGFKQIAADPSWRRWMGARVRLLMYRDLGQMCYAE
ncbi:acyl-CoA N-acyltransferase [Haematococcus lacustris]